MNATERETLARNAFCGCNEALYDCIAARFVYEHDGVTCMPNGLTLAQCVEVMRTMPEQEIQEALAVG